MMALRILAIAVFFTTITGAGSPSMACFIIECFGTEALKAYMSFGLIC